MCLSNSCFSGVEAAVHGNTLHSSVSVTEERHRRARRRTDIGSLSLLWLIARSSSRPAPAELYEFAVYIGPPMSALVFAPIAICSLDVDDAPRVALWIAAQAAVALTICCAREVDEAITRAFLGQTFVMTVSLFVLLRNEVDFAGQSDLSTLWFLLVVAALGGVVAGAPIAICQCSLVCTVERLRGTRSLDAHDRIIQSSFGRIATLNLVVACLIVAREPRALPGALAACVVPGGTAIYFAARRALVRRWLERIDRGLVAGWRIVDHRSEWWGLDLPTLYAPTRNGDGDQACRYAIVRVATAHHPFRDADRVMPVALVTR